MPTRDGVFIPKAHLAQSTFHHIAMGSPKRYSDDPESLHRPLHEFMDDAELAEYVEHEIEVVKEALAEARQDSKHARKFTKLRENHLLPNLKYLEGVDRLPAGVDPRQLALILIL